MRIDTKQAAHVLRTARTAATHPRESVERIQGRLDARSDRRRVSASGGPHQLYRPVENPLQALHDSLGLPYPCEDAERFSGLWDSVIAGLRSAGTRVGLASYRGWNDGDAGMAAATWCMVRHVAPDEVIETGVAHGLMSRIMLEGLERNGRGQLYSVDLPAVDPVLHGEIGIAVTAQLSERWTYLAGTSRARLPDLLHDHSDIDLFVHDSLHTGRNTRFELDAVWPALRPGGVVLVDDIHRSRGFRDFVEAVSPAAWFAADHILGSGMWGAAVKQGTSNDGRAVTPARLESTPD